MVSKAEALIAAGLAFFLDAGKAERKKAIDAGAARWAIDPATGERRFVYGTGKE